MGYLHLTLGTVDEASDCQPSTGRASSAAVSSRPLPLPLQLPEYDSDEFNSSMMILHDDDFDEDDEEILSESDSNL